MTTRPACLAVGLVAITAICTVPVSATPLACVVSSPATTTLEGPPVYYAVDLVTTGRLPGTRRASGVADVTFARSPFGVRLSDEGEYVYDLAVRVSGLVAPADSTHVAWVTSADLSRVARLGVLDEQGAVQGAVEWNKFLVVITREESPSDDAARWSGPIVLRGMSRSGRMHTMAGHGPYQAEPCAKYGY